EGFVVNSHPLRSSRLGASGLRLLRRRDRYFGHGSLLRRRISRSGLHAVAVGGGRGSFFGLEEVVQALVFRHQRLVAGIQLVVRLPKLFVFLRELLVAALEDGRLCRFFFFLRRRALFLLVRVGRRRRELMAQAVRLGALQVEVALHFFKQAAAINQATR